MFLRPWLDLRNCFFFISVTHRLNSERGGHVCEDSLSYFDLSSLGLVKQ